MKSKACSMGNARSYAWPWQLYSPGVTYSSSTPLLQDGAASQETRIFLRLRDSSKRAGIPAAALHSPLSLTRHLEAIRHPAAPAAKRVVEEYVRVRFSGLLMREDQEKEMVDALRAASLMLRKNPLK